MMLLALLALPCAAGAEEAEVYTLDNGLRVVLDQMDFSPTVAVLVQYQVGARNESAEISGISHFTEHMLFNGTKDMPGQRFWQLVEREGGQANGGTGTDQTTYFIYFPSSQLEKAIRMEADRMRNCLLDSAAIAQEIGVVTDEWRLGQDYPDNQLFQRAGAAFYGDHPLGRTVLGTGETIAAFSGESVRSYYETWYRPANAILTIAGDFDRDEAVALIEEYFGSIPCDGPSPDNVPAITDWDYPERLDFEFPAESDRFLIYFQGCGPDSPDIPALMLLSVHFSGGRLGWMQRELVNSGLLSSASASSPWGLDPHPFSFYGNVQEGVDTDSMITVVIGEALRMAEEPIGEERLSMLQDYLLAREQNRVNTPLSQAYKLTYSLALYGDVDGEREMLERVAELTPEDVRAVAEEYFTPGRMMVSVLHATEGGAGAPGTSVAGTTETVVPEVLDWTGLDLAGSFVLPEFSISEGVVRFELDNGLVLLVKEDHSFPNLEIMATLPMCPRREDPGKCGISSITAELMLRGTGEIGFEPFHERLAVLGSTTWLQVFDNYTLGNVYGLSEYADIYFTSLSDMLLRPALTEEDFEGVRTILQGSIAMSHESPFSEARQGLDEILLQPGNGRRATEETVSSITHGDVVEWWRSCVRPEGCVIAIVGDITPENALSLAEEYFGSWGNPDPPLPERVEPAFSGSPGDTLVITMPGKIQVTQLMGCRAPSFLSRDYVPFMIMNRILGGGFGSRLVQSIREVQGLAYSVASYVDGTSSGSAAGCRFFTYLTTGAPFALRALDAAVHETGLIPEEGVEVEELLLQQSSSMGIHALSYDSYDAQARYLAECATMGIPLDHDLITLRAIAELDQEDIQEIADEYFTGDWFVVTAGGVDGSLEPLD
jgi:zinc protease